jgi:hypothetical protein
VDSESNIKKTDGTDIAYQESLMHEQPITLTYQRTALRHRRLISFCKMTCIAGSALDSSIS